MINIFYAQKKSYSKIIEKQGIPNVISYKHKEKLKLDFKFQKYCDHITYDRKDIYESKDKIISIDIKKNYINLF